VFRISEAIAAREGVDPDRIKAELLEQISGEIARRTAAAVSRRRRATRRVPEESAHIAALLAATRSSGTAGGQEEVPSEAGEQA
jgi:hypothetical protein